MNEHEKKYLRRVRKWLPCTCGMKKRIMGQITERIGEWVDENPNAGYAELEAHFGEPRQIAAAYIENIGTDELLQDLRLKQRIMQAVTAAVLAVVLIWGAAVTIVAVDAMIETHYRRFESSLTVYD